MEQRAPVWQKKARKDRPSLSWLWTNPSLVLALPLRRTLDLLSVRVQSGSAKLSDIKLKELDGEVTDGSLRMQDVSCQDARLSATSSSIESKSLVVSGSCELSASSARISLQESLTATSGYRVHARSGSLSIGTHQLMGSGTLEQEGSPFFSIGSESSRIAIAYTSRG
ncbi:DUF4097 family beta strand repeat-containing protein [Bifidobacterium aemilianum]